MDNTNVNVSPQDQAIEKLVDRRVDDRLDQIFTPEVSSRIKKAVQDGKMPILSNEQRLAYALRVWRNNGLFDRQTPAMYHEKNRSHNQKRIGVYDLAKALNDSAFKAKEILGEGKGGIARLDDFQQPTDASILMAQVISTVVREATEPMLVLTSLMRRMSFQGEQITFPAVGAFTAEDMAPTQEYPERALEMVGQVVAKIGKVGVAVRFSDEMLRYSLFDIMTMHVQAAGRAMARHKEKKVATLISGEGSTIFDNDNNASALRGFTTGRDVNGNANGTFTLQDLFQMFADLLNAGYVPNTLLMNPMGWLIFAQNETLRSFGFANGGPLWGAIAGAPGLAPTFGGNPNLYKAGGAAASLTPAAQPNATLNSPVPTMFPAPLSVVVSPFITFTSATQATDIIMCDRDSLGIYVEDEGLMVEQFDDPSRDMTKVKMRERYSFCLDNEGQAVAVAKGVRIKKGYDWDDIELNRTYPSTGLPPITGII